MTTPRLGAPELATSQSNKEETVNEALYWLDAASLGGFKVIDRNLATPPGSPAQGDCYILPASPTGAWALGSEDDVALYINTTWEIRTPQEGWEAWVVDEAVKVGFTSGAWVIIGTFDSATYATEDDVALSKEWAPNFSADGDVYIPCEDAMTIDQGNAKIGTGTIAFSKSTTAAPSTFSSTTLPATLQAGAWLKVSATGVTGYCATHLKRTA